MAGSLAASIPWTPLALHPHGQALGAGAVGHDRVSAFRSGVLRHADRGVSGVSRSGPERPDAGRIIVAAGDWHDDLPVVEQRDNSSGGEEFTIGAQAGFVGWLAATIGLGVAFSAARPTNGTI